MQRRTLLAPVLVSLAATVAGQVVEKINLPLARGRAGQAGPGGDVTGYLIAPDGAWITFVADADSDEVYELYARPTDASAPVRKLSGTPVAGGDVTGNAITPDGVRAVYLADALLDGMFELFVAPIDGSAAPQRLSAAMPASRDVEGFLVSPDGARVVFSADRDTDERFELYSVPIDGSAAPIEISAPMAIGGIPRSALAGFFSLPPTGSRVVYRANQDSSLKYELYSVPIDGSASPVKLNPALLSGAGAVSFSPDGARCFFTADVLQFSLLVLHSVPIDGSAAAVPLSGTTGIDPARYSVDPTGARVLYRADPDTAGQYELFSVPSDGSAAPVRLNHPLAANEDVLDLRASLDGLLAVFTTRDGVLAPTKIFRAPIAGGASPVQLNDTSGLPPDAGTFVAFSLAPGRLIWSEELAGEVSLRSVPLDLSQPPVRLDTPLVAGGGVRSTRLAPGGSNLLYVADRVTDETYELWTVPIAGGTPVRLSPPLGPQNDVSSLPPFGVTPDGTKVVFLGDIGVDGSLELWVGPTSSAGAIEFSAPLSAGPVLGDVSLFTWSPDARTILYTADEGALGEETLTAVDAGDLSRVGLSGPPLEFDGYSVMDIRDLQFPTADPAQVLFTRGRVEPFYSPQILTLESARLADGERHVVNLSGSGRPAAGERVVFVARESGGEQDYFHLFVSALDGTGEQLLSLGGAESVGPWTLAPAGDEAAFFETDTLHAVALDGTAPRFLGVPAGASTADSHKRLAIDPTGSELAFSGDFAVTDRNELWHVPLDGSAAPQRLNPLPIAGGDVDLDFATSPDGSRVVYRADLDLDELFELHGAPWTGGTSVRLSAPMVTGGDVAPAVDFQPQFAVSPDSTRVVYRADQATNDVFELFSAPLDGSSPAVRLNAPLAGGKDVEVNAFRFTPDGRTVVYAADQDTDGVLELYAVPVDGSASPTKLNPPLVAGGSLLADTSYGMRDTLALSSGGRHAFYLADQDLDGTVELYSVALSSPGSARKRNAFLAPNRDVVGFALGLGGARVLYKADQDADEVYELYLSTLPASGLPSAAPRGSPRAGGMLQAPD
jgi:Tol biopolymer transport system component